MSDYIEAQEAQDLVTELFESEHSRLKGLRVKCLFKEGAPIRDKGALAYARIRKTTGALAYYSKADFIIEISLCLWEDLKDNAKRAIIDHELCHIALVPTKDGHTKWVLQPHDIEEFYVILERYGCYLDEMKRLKNVEWGDGKDKSNTWDK